MRARLARTTSACICAQAPAPPRAQTHISATNKHALVLSTFIPACCDILLRACRQCLGKACQRRGRGEIWFLRWYVAVLLREIVQLPVEERFKWRKELSGRASPKKESAPGSTQVKDYTNQRLEPVTANPQADMAKIDKVTSGLTPHRNPLQHCGASGSNGAKKQKTGARAGVTDELAVPSAMHLYCKEVRIDAADDAPEIVSCLRGGRLQKVRTNGDGACGM